MATSRKPNDSTLKKDQKKVTPSSSTRRQASPKPTAGSSASSNKDNSTIPSGKPIPNYLKPTLRSESLKNVKKTGQDDTTQKPLLRRRSLDRPPSTSYAQKSNTSSVPKERPASRDRIASAVRSASLSSKNTASTRHVLERNVRSSSTGKPQPAKRYVTRSMSPSATKKESSSSSVSPKNETNDHGVTENLKQESDGEPLVSEAEETPNVASEEQVPSDDLQKIEDEKAHPDAVGTEINNEEDEKLKPSEISTVSEEENNINVSPSAAQVEETENEPQEGGGENKQEEENHSTLDDQGGNIENPEVGPIENEAEVGADDHDDQVKIHENANESVENNEGTISAGEENKQEGNIEKDNEGNIDKDNEGSKEAKAEEGQEDQVEESVQEEAPTPETDDVVEKKTGGSKKESPAAYNDVIEETKNKLLEERKNKVKALVGAFETVIDYESK